MNTFTFKYRLTDKHNWQFLNPFYTTKEVEDALWISLSHVVTLYQLDDMQALKVQVEVAN